MRNIKFRGILNTPYSEKQWIYGYLSKSNDGSFVISDNNGIGYDVDEETIGQYTGLKDKNGKEIYEGDIVRKECLDEFYEGGPVIGIVKMVDGTWLIKIDYFDGILLYNNIYNNEVVGNMFENRELLEENKNE